MRRKGKGCQFIWGRSLQRNYLCGRQGTAVHVTLAEHSRDLPLADGVCDGTFVLCRYHTRCLADEGAEIVPVGSLEAYE
jgi:hypothetical protein